MFLNQLKKPPCSPHDFLPPSPLSLLQASTLCSTPPPRARPTHISEVLESHAVPWAVVKACALTPPPVPLLHGTSQHLTTLHTTTHTTTQHSEPQ